MTRCQGFFSLTFISTKLSLFDRFLSILFSLLSLLLLLFLRACFKKLPRILSFNTMRYTFNMVTMMKEKVNTHFSFPLRLDMTPYTEDFLMGKGDRKEGKAHFLSRCEGSEIGARLRRVPSIRAQFPLFLSGGNASHAGFFFLLLNWLNQRVIAPKQSCDWMASTNQIPLCPSGFREEGESKVAESYEYDLIGVTVHTGTADGGHYYSFIRDIVNPHAYKSNKW